MLFTLSLAAPAAGNFAGSVAPIGDVTAGHHGAQCLRRHTESGFADFFTYKNVLYTFVKSEGVYVAVQKSYTVYVSLPAVGPAAARRVRPGRHDLSGHRRHDGGRCDAARNQSGFDVVGDIASTR